MPKIDSLVQHTEPLTGADEMNKSARGQVEKAIKFASIEPGYAARTIAAIHNAASKRDMAELFSLIAAHNLSAHISMVNGCMVPRSAA